MPLVIRDREVRNVPESLYNFAISLGFQPYFEDYVGPAVPGTEPAQGSVPRYDQDTNKYLPGSLEALAAEVANAPALAEELAAAIIASNDLTEELASLVVSSISAVVINDAALVAELASQVVTTPGLTTQLLSLILNSSSFAAYITARLGDVADPTDVAAALVSGVVDAKLASGDIINRIQLRDASALAVGGVERGVVGAGPKLVTIAGRGGGKHNAFPGLAQLPDGRLIVAYREANEHQVVVSPSNSHIKQSISIDFGRTWSTPVTSFNVASTDDVRDPALMVTNTGRLVMTYFVSTVDNWDDIHCFSRYSDDAGTTWSAATAMPFAFDTHGAAITAPAAIAPDGSLVAVAYGMNAAGTLRRVRLCRSTNNAASWTDAGLVASHASRSFDEPFIGVRPDGSLMVLIRSDDNPENIYKVTSSDSGATWSAATVAFQGTGRPAWLALSSGHIITASRKLAGQQVTVSRISGDNGATWSPEVPLDDENITCTYAQMVEIADGTVAVCFSGQPDNDSAYVKFGYLTNGITWTPLGDYVKPSAGYGPPTGFAAGYGTVYTDRSVTAGASTWINKSDVFGTVWVPLEMDTGHRLVAAAGAVTDLPNLAVSAERVGGFTYVECAEGAAGSSSGGKLLCTLPVGMRPDNPTGVASLKSGTVIDQNAAPIVGSTIYVEQDGKVWLTAVSGKRHFGSLVFPSRGVLTALPGSEA